jgi:hypothetical protein
MSQLTSSFLSPEFEVNARRNTESAVSFTVRLPFTIDPSLYSLFACSTGNILLKLAFPDATGVPIIRVLKVFRNNR